MKRLTRKVVIFLVSAACCASAARARAQAELEETLSGPDSHETSQGPHGHLFGDWGGERTRLLRSGVRFDLQYISDSLWNIKIFSFEPMAYALGNLFTDFESFDPPPTPALEVRVVPIHNLYVKSMVEAGNRTPFAHNPSGFVPQFRGAPASISEIGFTPGKRASSVRTFDNVKARKGSAVLYQFGASYNPGKFTTAKTNKTNSGNYLWYWP